MAVKNIITISRQYGSGGRLIGKNLAAVLGIPFYDKELISLAAKKSGLNEDILRKVDEQASNSLLYSLAMGMYSTGNVMGPMADLPLNDKAFIVQANIIRELAEKGPCVIVGRCADYILKDHPDRFSVFIHAPIESRVERAVKYYNLSKENARSAIIKIDKRRRSYHDYYSDIKWGNGESYHLCLDSSRLGIDTSMEVIRAALKTE